MGLIIDRYSQRFVYKQLIYPSIYVPIYLIIFLISYLLVIKRSTSLILNICGGLHIMGPSGHQII